MKRLRAATTALLALSAGCSDGGTTEPKPDFRVEIRRGTLAFEEETLPPGNALVLSAAVLDDRGKPVPGQTVQWKSSAPDVATVSPEGMVTGVRAGGFALIVASAGSGADTARVNVAALLTGAVSCVPGAPRPSLAPGQAFEASAYEAAVLCAEGGPAGAEYLLVPFHGSRVSGASLAVSLEAAGVGEAPATTTSGVAGEPAATGAVPDRDFHLRLRERALPGLERRMRALHETSVPSFAAAPAPLPAEGDLLRLNVQARGEDGCTSPDYRTGRVVAVTRRAIVVADTANPAGFSSAEYRQFGVGFDENIFPLGVEHFGEPSDLDDNGRAILFFTRAVNELTTPGSGFYIAGFFYDRDLFPQKGEGACAGSNQAEMFYLMVPDEARAVAGEPVFSLDKVRSHTLAVVGHEFQHLINAGRRLHVNKAPVWEETWLNEGLSHIAEELLFYRSAGLRPGQNLDGAGWETGAAGEAFRSYQLQNMERLLRFIGNPQAASPIAAGNDLSTRGAAWSLLRYAADRRGADERSLWRALVNSRTSGLSNLGAALGQDPVPWMRDWAVSMYADDAGLPLDGRYRQASWNLRDLIGRWHLLAGTRRYTDYPLRTVALAEGRPAGLTLPAGGAAYVRFSVPAGQTAAVRTASRQLPAPSTLRLVLVRTR